MIHRYSSAVRLLEDVARGSYGYCLHPPACREGSLQASPRSPGSRAWSFQTCMGSATTQGRPVGAPPLHRFLGHQSHGPAGAALWRVTAHHGDDPLLLTVFQNCRSAGPRLVVERGFEATRLVTMADLPNRLRREWDHAGNPG